MTPASIARRRVACAGALMALAGLSACAGGKPPPSSTPAPPPPTAAAPPPLVTMAPIANPEKAAPTHREPATRPRSGEAASRRPGPAHPAAPGVPAAAASSAADPAQAARLRARGLEELNRGSVAKAVALLSQASRLDPGSAVIRRDLERAERINRAVQTPH